MVRGSPPRLVIGSSDSNQWSQKGNLFLSVLIDVLELAAASVVLAISFTPNIHV